jgi:hypothetical protein
LEKNVITVRRTAVPPLKLALKKIRPIEWSGLGTGALMLLMHIATGAWYMFPLYAISGTSIAMVEKYRHKTPKIIRTLLLGVLFILFGWASMTASLPAHALFFDKVFSFLTTYIGFFGTAATALTLLPQQIVAFLKFIGIIAFSAVVIVIFKSRDDEDETRRWMSKILRWILVLILADIVISIVFA